ncbi:DUF4189 domain-containing protein [Xanthomonas campestris]|uniref:DUF4189 domain-containing protein n=1 Tax=Xanthomonas campestris TaxID=339 RepID=UPI002365074A|nr:DUF4189 domain-containing protein [Xanthomonas campestris]WDJ07612.1 DUF4189 domain-containing protein [Xanthomonas campestris pv. incanae]
MKKLSALIRVIFIYFVYYSGALAEGNCPSGYYPIGGQGVSGCAPMSPSNNSAPQPTGEWRTRWGALAYSKDDKILGVAESKASKSDARKAAVDFCTQAGGVGCKVQVFYKNGCIAIASSQATYSSKTSTSASKVRAESIALEECGKSDCKIYYSGCSQAAFRSY